MQSALPTKPPKLFQDPDHAESIDRAILQQRLAHLRALGWRDYHPRMRGLASKWRNFLGLLARLRQIRTAPDKVRFERMAPIIRQPFQPDDDAIVVTNPVEMTFFLRRAGCEILSVECTDRYVPRVVDFILNATPLRYAMFNSFVVARRR